jgi:hypothetical protein
MGAVLAGRRVALFVVLALAVPATGTAARTSRACAFKARGLPVYIRLSGDATPAACAWFNKALQGTVWRGRVPGRVYGVWVAKGSWHARLTIYSTEEQFGRNYCNQVEDDLSGDFTRIR